MRGRDFSRYPHAHGVGLGPTEIARPHASTTVPEPDVLDEEHLTDEDLLAELVKDWSIPCEFHIDYARTCGAPATWWVICRSCGRTAAECVQHRVSEAADWALAPTGWLHCDRCWTRVPKAAWRDLVIIIPIGARA